MAWQMSGDMVEFCSCKLLCPCWLGPMTEPDQGWCSGSIAFDIHQGSIDGVDVGGSRVVLVADWPGNFFGGQGKARLYLDGRDDQRRELEAVFSGQKGGLLAGVMGAVVTHWLPAQPAPIAIQRGEQLSITVGQVCQATLAPLKNQAGQPTTVQGSAAQEAFQLTSMVVASSQGSQWSDPDLRHWAGDSGTIHTFNWSA